MASNVVAICNLGLGRVKASRIEALTENSKEAEECERLYEDRRDVLLTSYAWGFAKTTKALALTSGETSDEWQYVYDYPNDCLRVHYILPPESGSAVSTGGVSTPHIDYEPIPYEVMSGDGTRRIHTDYEDAYIEYTKKVTDVALMDPLFTDMLGWFMAIDLAIPLGGDSAKKYRDDAKESFKEASQNAIAHSGNEKEKGRPRLPRAIQARRGSIDRDYFHNDLTFRRY